MSLHRPPHLYLDNTWYIITAATYYHELLLESEQAKQCLRDALQIGAQRNEITLRAWVILDNHYHLLLKTKRGHTFSQFFRQLHGNSAHQINLHNNKSGRKVWQNYWDTAIRTETDLWMRFNYIHMNPVKHGYVEKPGDWPFSSYH